MTCQGNLLPSNWSRSSNFSEFLTCARASSSAAMPPFALMNFFKVSSHTFFIDAMLDTKYRQESPAMQDIIILLTNQPHATQRHRAFHHDKFRNLTFTILLISTSLNVACFLFIMAFCRCNYGSETHHASAQSRSFQNTGLLSKCLSWGTDDTTVCQTPPLSSLSVLKK